MSEKITYTPGISAATRGKFRNPALFDAAFEPLLKAYEESCANAWRSSRDLVLKGGESLQRAALWDEAIAKTFEAIMERVAVPPEDAENAPYFFMPRYASAGN